MSGKSRSCSLCGVSFLSNPTLTFHKFPKPGNSAQTLLRARIWAKYCYPDKDFSSVDSLMKLHTAHKMLCSKHFDSTCYTEGPKKRLNIFSIPCGSTPILNALQTNVVMDKEPVIIRTSTVVVENKPNLQDQETTSQVQQENKRKLKILQEMNTHKVSQITHRKQKLYRYYRRNLSEISRLRCKLKNLKQKDPKINTLHELANNNNLQNMVKRKMSRSFSFLLQSQLNKTTRKSKGRRWSVDDKVLALSIYKKSAACYRLLRRLFCLPSQTTLKCLLNEIPIKCGINKQIFDYLKDISSNRSSEDNLCILMFDEMSIRKNLTYNNSLDIIDGFQDHGNQGRSFQVASHALVFMVAGIRKKWKQPITL